MFVIVMDRFWRGPLWWLPSAVVALLGAYELVTQGSADKGDDSVVGAWSSAGGFASLGLSLLLMIGGVVVLAGSVIAHGAAVKRKRELDLERGQDVSDAKGRVKGA